MKIISVNLSNFASYKELEFNFDDQGLVLIHGATGSGKSTLMDAIPWILFGKTAKGGNADEVISWPGDINTKGHIRLEINGEFIQIERSRNSNDLWYSQEHINHGLVRGKDLQDTQKLINQLLGFDYDMYMASAYYHEFSQTAQFFTTTAKNRRQITEQLVDLSLPLKLSESIKIDLKAIKTALTKANIDHENFRTKVDIFTQMIKDLQIQSQVWGQQQASKILSFQFKSDSFEVVKGHKINALEKQILDVGYDKNIADNEGIELLEADLPPEFAPCETCGTPKVDHEREATLEVLQELKEDIRLHQAKGKEITLLTKQLSELKASKNVYLEQIQELKSETSPHTESILNLNKDLVKSSTDKEAILANLANIKDQELNLELLSDAVTTLRSELVRTTIESLESQTNTLLRDHFESEIQVNFNIAESDKLEVLITKDSNECQFTQLSKGQRGILKLCFGFAVMRTISKHNNLDIKQLFADEATDGFDENNKLRAVKMFETLALEYDNIYLVDHSEVVKAMVDQKYLVELINGNSQIIRV